MYLPDMLSWVWTDKGSNPLRNSDHYLWTKTDNPHIHADTHNHTGAAVECLAQRHYSLIARVAHLLSHSPANMFTDGIQTRSLQPKNPFQTVI